MQSNADSDQLRPPIDPNEVQKFLRALDPAAKWFTLQTFTDLEQKPTPDPLAKIYNVSRITSAVLHRYGEGAGVWVTVNDTDGNGRKKKDVVRVRAIWQEDDDGFEGQFPLEPSVVVESSPGHYHRYWLVEPDWPADEQGRRDFAGVMECMVACYGSDPGAKDISRVLRLPGFQHRKNPEEPHMVRIVGGNRQRYTREQITTAFPAPQKQEKRGGSPPPHANGHAGADYASTAESHAELVRQVLTGEHYHPALCSLAFRLVGSGMPAAQAEAQLRGMMLTRPSEEHADTRWQSRFAQIPDLVRSAVKKRSSNGAMPEEDWPDPVSLPQDLVPVMQFSPDLLPEKLRPWVQDIARRMQCPLAFVAVTVLVALGAVIGRQVSIRPKMKDAWTVVVNLWGMVIGSPGTLKTPAMNEGLKPLDRLAAQARESFKLAQAEYDLKARVAKTRTAENEKQAGKEAAKKDANTAIIEGLLKPVLPEGEEPIQKRYTTVKATGEALAVLCRQNPNGILVKVDELLSLLDRLDEEGHSDERALYLTGWDGNTSHTDDRIGRGLDLHVPSLTISLFGSTQPARISQYLHQLRRGGRADDGLIQRLQLMVWPDGAATWENVDEEPDKDAAKVAFGIFKRLDELDWRAIGAKRDLGFEGEEDGIPYLRFSADAQIIFDDWRTKHENRILPGCDIEPAMVSHLSKYRSLVPSLALILHLVDGERKVTEDGSFTDIVIGPVEATSLARAIQWSEYLETHAARVYACGSIAVAVAAKAIMAKVESGHLLKTGFSSRDVWRPKWSKLGDKDVVMTALKLLEDYDWLRTSKKETGGRTATIYVVNPKAIPAEPDGADRKNGP